MNPRKTTAYEEAMKQNETDRKKGKFRLHGLDLYVIFSLSIVIIYTVAEFVTATITGVEKSSLTMAVYGFWAGEIITCGLIRIFGLRKGGTEDED